jgi:hypothetical protein
MVRKRKESTILLLVAVSRTCIIDLWYTTFIKCNYYNSILWHNNKH